MEQTPVVSEIVPPLLNRRLLGAFYTPLTAADFMADWVVRKNGESILEPSFGDGIFLRAISKSASRRSITGIQAFGIEIDESTLVRASADEEISAANLQRNDFIEVVPFKVQAVVGNPPYVRLRRLSTGQRERALELTSRTLGYAMEPSGSLWMPFVLHAMQFLDTGGRLAFVLPYDFTYVRYARPLWDLLRRKFGSLQIIRSHERLFSDLLQDVVILLADQYDSSTEFVRYTAFEKVRDLVNGNPVVDESIEIADIVAGERVFIEALLGQELRNLLRSSIAKATLPARKMVTFNIGYVTGDKVFFHPDEARIRQYRLPARSLHAALTSARAIRNTGLWTSGVDASRVSKLFLPNPKRLTKGESNYITMGDEEGVSKRHKCQVREPWYVVPGTRTPDVILTVFSERPVLQVNDAEFFASNSLLCGYTSRLKSTEIAARWYTSLTLLQCELEIHALGGGVMIVVPNEAGNVRLPADIVSRSSHLEAVDRMLGQGKVTEAYRAGDKDVLTSQLGLKPHDIDLIRHGIDVLAHWRTSARSSLL